MILHAAGGTSIGCSSSSAIFICDESKLLWHSPKDGGGRIIRKGRRSVERSNFLGESLRKKAPAFAISSRKPLSILPLNNRDDDGSPKVSVVARALERRQSSLDSWPDRALERRPSTLETWSDDGPSRGSRWDKVKSRHGSKEQWKPKRPPRKVEEPSNVNDRDSDAQGMVEGLVQADAEAEEEPAQPIQRALWKAKKQAIFMKDYLKSVDVHKLFTSTGEQAHFPPFPPITGTMIAGAGAILIVWVILDALIWRVSRESPMKNVVLENDASEGSESLRSRAPSALSVLLDRDLRRKESVEWVNMVIGKFWNLYRRGLENWLVGLLQPVIDDLEKPDYVKKVQVEQFFLGDEPVTVRTVERRTSRRADDLQYHVGVRYTGGARLLLAITLKWWIVPITIPVGVRGFDIDAEVWVKMRMVPYEPWIGQATWAFVSLPKIKLALAPFRLLNLMAIPFLSIFLAKLLTEDLPMQFVRPNKNVIDLVDGRAVGPVSKDFKDGVIQLDGSMSFAGELTVTLVEARRTSYIPYLKTDPYCIFVLGDQVRRSKRNSQTSIIGPPGAPVWNQDFQLLVVDPKTQHLSLTLHDTMGFTSYPVGSGEIDLRTLQDTVPVDRKLTLRSGWGPFPKRFAGELILRLTYKAYIDDDVEEGLAEELTPKGTAVLDVPGAVEQVQEVATFFKEEAGKVAEFFQDKDVAKEMFSALPVISSDTDVEKVLPVLGFEVGKKENESVQTKSSADSDPPEVVIENDKVVTISGSESNTSSESIPGGKSVDKQAINEQQAKDNSVRVEGPVEGPSTAQLVLWLAVATGIVWIVAADLNLTNLFNP